MTDTAGNITSFEDDDYRLQPKVETKARDDQGIEVLKDIVFGSVIIIVSLCSHGK
jgi:hypothetical protein